jgi:hypothetical protein
MVARRAHLSQDCQYYYYFVAALGRKDFTLSSPPFLEHA